MGQVHDAPFITHQNAWDARYVTPNFAVHIFGPFLESNTVVQILRQRFRRRRHVHALHVAVELARVAIFELDAIGDDLKVLARWCDLDVRYRQQLILAFERFIDGARRLLAAGHLSPPFLGEDARPAGMFETNPLAVALVAALVADFQRRRLFGVIEAVEILDLDPAGALALTGQDFRCVGDWSVGDVPTREHVSTARTFLDCEHHDFTA